MKHVIVLLALLLLAGATSAPPADQPDARSLATSVQSGEKEIKAAYFQLRQAAASETRTEFLRHFQQAIHELEKIPESAAIAKAILATNERSLLMGIDALVESKDLSGRTAQGLKQSIKGRMSLSATQDLVIAHREETKYTMMLAKFALLDAELQRTVARLSAPSYEGNDMDSTAYRTRGASAAGDAWDGAKEGGAIGGAVGGTYGGTAGVIIGGAVGTVGGPPGIGAGGAVGLASGGGIGTLVGGAIGGLIGAIVGLFTRKSDSPDDDNTGENKDPDAEGDGVMISPDPNDPCNDPWSLALC